MPLPSAAGARQPRTAEDRLVRSLERQVARLGAEGKGAQVGSGVWPAMPMLGPVS